MLLLLRADRMDDRAVRRPSISSRLLARLYARPLRAELRLLRRDMPPSLPPKPTSGSDCDAIIAGACSSGLGDSNSLSPRPAAARSQRH